MEPNAPAGWSVVDGMLTSTFSTGTFANGLDLVNRIGEIAEEANHHPDVLLTYPSVEIRLVSHDVGEITDRDTRLAETVSKLADTLGIGYAPPS